VASKSAVSIERFRMAPPFSSGWGIDGWASGLPTAFDFDANLRNECTFNYATGGAVNEEQRRGPADVRVDDLDIRILAELQEDGRRSYREMSQRLGVAPGTVRSRLLQLIEDGIVQVIAVPNPLRMGYMFHATVGLRLKPGHSEEVAQLLAAREEVGWVGLVASGYDLLFEIYLRDNWAFGTYKEDFLANLPGVEEIDVFQHWGVRKFHYRLSPPDEMDLAVSTEEETAVEGGGT
jgi:Lrp/AsnC family transcriptional regulator for asnA, asnC and gidA